MHGSMVLKNFRFTVSGPTWYPSLAPFTIS